MTLLEKWKRAVVFDLETTGTDVNTDRIVQIAWSTYGPKGFEQAVDFLVNPGQKIPKEASDVHGITDEMVAEAPPFERVAADVFRVFDSATVLVGYNVLRFDVPLLMSEFARCAIPWEPAPVLDGFKLYTKLEPRDLEAAHRRFVGVDMANAHDAGADVVATVATVDAMAKAFEIIEKTPDEILAIVNEPDAVDLEGKMKRLEDGAIIFTFGKHNGKTVDWVKDNDRGWLEWAWTKLGAAFRSGLRKALEESRSTSEDNS